jgi:CRISPR-associated protein Cas1
LKNFYVFQDCSIQRKDNTIFLKTPLETKRIPCEVVENIHLFGEINLNTSLLNFIASKGILLHTYNYYGFYTGTFTPKETNVSGKLLVNQVLFYNDSEKRMIISRQLIKAAIFNMNKVLKYYKNRSVNLDEEISYIDIMKDRAERCQNAAELMGVEGNVRKIYYSCFSKIINSDDFEFEKRVKKPPDNAVNSLMSFLNSLMYTTCLSEIYKTQLNPTISYLHEPSTKRFSLSLDIAEIFKPIIVDRLIFSLLNKKIITINDFEENSACLVLKENGRKRIIEHYEERIATTIMHRTLGREVSYRHLIRLECYKLIKHLLGEKEYDGFKIWW